MSYSLPIDLQERPRIVNTATTSIEHTDTEQCAAAAVAAGQTRAGMAETCVDESVSFFGL